MQTVITTFDVTPGTCQDLLDALSEAYETWIRRRPGFRAAAIHVNDARTRVAVRSEWDRREAFMDLLRSDQMRTLSRRLDALSRSFEPVLYDVVARIAAP